MKRRELLLRGGAAAACAAPMFDSQAASGAARRRRQYVDSIYGQLHVTTSAPPRARDARRTPVLCLPMSPRSGRDFDDFAAELARDRFVHCPDLPGFGGSDPPPKPPAIDDYAEAVLAGVRSLGISRRARAGLDLVGQHTGAAVAIEMARRAPQLVRRLVLIGVPMFSESERAQLRAEIVQPRPYFDDPQFLCRTWQRDTQALAAGQSRANMLMRFTEIMRAGEGSWWGFNAVFAYPTRERLSDLQQPVRGIVLDERLGPATREAARLVARGEPHDMRPLPGSALDFAAEALAAAAREFFDRESRG